MSDTSVLIAVAVAVVIHYLFKKYVDATKDVPDLYLSEQSLVEATRLSDQSAIYKSNKLDFGNGLRVGLDIRYNHYKIRHGNPCDVWELLVAGLKSNPQKLMVLNNEVIKISELNFKVNRVTAYLDANGIRNIAVKYSDFMASIDHTVILFACLINAVTVTFYQTSDDLQTLEVDHFGDQLLQEVDSILSATGELFTYENIYNFDKDKGARIRVVKKLDGSTIRTTEYLAVNLVSNIASTLKHLPPNETIGPKDTILVTNVNPHTSLVNTLCKVLTGFVTNSSVIITNSSSWENLVSYNPSVMFSDSSVYSKGELVHKLQRGLSVVGRTKYKLSMYFLSQGKFSRFGSSNLRLVYFTTIVGGPESCYFATAKLNQLRALLNARVIVEYGYDNLIGPVVLSDLYDYRVLDGAITENLVGSGCIFQAVEIKLVNLKSDNFGDIMVRGYNIGKVNNYIIGGGSGERVNKDNEGFMLLEGVKGKWGSDGCLYIYGE
ncbi:hypothetical protein PSN45_000077 [Yamadazyma tenuis]|uniref:AMP-dependent synthetase/ligase domain-containing protein n=1 Tax=Candida tenuis (strain ATCC 10573 / BCRC 21748 / CBS 615 / JCM 9827 / NBRC 10315 / NRRL Y-1498 / VKM Y-70) TaxID=590646 RepID=G3BAC2_CANTC|nr:uncharacterized protein CANTEDRAFT_108385 [Yamadazyma tenuis ATCC 10573]EGV61404.1 hypothetical protein CANTEDRAFT_108385 [Yamadazyma tenuis ATCC 10573]WEJ92624.1 hypothetical protein PSN45_000077 [Yamadazyma tenuis]